jgi:hypothetical protein
LSYKNLILDDLNKIERGEQRLKKFTIQNHSHRKAASAESSSLSTQCSNASSASSLAAPMPTSMSTLASTTTNNQISDESTAITNRTNGVNESGVLNNYNSNQSLLNNDTFLIEWNNKASNILKEVRLFCVEVFIYSIINLLVFNHWFIIFFLKLGE